MTEALQPKAKITETWAYGYGWFLDDLEGVETRPFSHGGGDGTEAIAYPADEAVVIFLTHSRWGRHILAFWNRLGMSGLLEHLPGYGIDVDELMVWASEQNVPEVELLPEEHRGYAGTYLVEQPREDAPERLLVWEEGDRLHVRLGAMDSKADQRYHLVPLGDDRFALGRYEGGRLRAVDPSHAIRFIMEEDVDVAVEVEKGDGVVFSGRRAQ